MSQPCSPRNAGKTPTNMRVRRSASSSSDAISHSLSTCHTLALVSEHEGDYMVEQARGFIERIDSANKRLHVFTQERDGSHDHCQLDNLSRGQQVMYDCLDDVFDYRHPK